MECSPATRDWKVLSLSNPGGASASPAQGALRASPSAEKSPADQNRIEPEKGKLAPFLPLLSGLVENQPRAKIKDFYLTLQDQGYQGSYDLVKKKVHAFRRELGRQAGLAFASPDLPQAQVELGKILLKGGSREVRAFLFTMVLGHSGRFYAELLDACEMGRFLQAHQNAFEAFGGIPKAIFYDPQESPLMRRLVGGYPFHLPVVDCGNHYGYSALPTPPFSPWMKGRLKRPCKILRKLYFPTGEFQSLEVTNAEMQDWLFRHMRQAANKDRKDRVHREKLALLPAIGFNFRGRRQFLRLRA
jgi:transposase